jgi:fido (protein-threonine AMPylation protein)
MDQGCDTLSPKGFALTVFRRWRLKKIHAKFLESFRNLMEGRQYLDQTSGFRRWILETFCPVPLLALDQDGERLLEALQWLETHCRERPLSEQVIRDYHRMIYNGGAEPAGEYRRGRISVIGSTIPRPRPEKVPTLMKQLNLKLEDVQRKFDPMNRVDESAVLIFAVNHYQRIGLIHPFADANGRVARLAMNHLLRRYEMGFVILPPLSEAPELFDALQLAHAGNLGRLLEIARKCVRVV